MPRHCLVGLLLLVCGIGVTVAQERTAQQPGTPPTPHWIAPLTAAPAPGYFRATLTLPEKVELDFADLFVAAHSKASVTINGVRQGEARGTERFAHFAVTKWLVAGKNTIAVELTPGEKSPALLLSLHVVDREGRSYWLATDDQWKTSEAAPEGWLSADFDDKEWKAAAKLGPIGAAPWGAPTTEAEHYHQWKQALGAETAVDPRTFKLPPGYKVELLRSAGKTEGSWISLAFDDQGRLLVSREDKGILRLTLAEMPRRELAGESLAQQIKLETINDTLLECRGLLCVGKDLYVNANNTKGLYRLRDTDGDDTFDEVKLLRDLPGDVGHGRNDLTLGPDGKLYLMYGNDVRYPTDDQLGTSPLRNFGQDRLLPCEWNKFLFNSGVTAPGGYVVRTDLEAKTWDVVAGGFRNAYGIAFNGDGEMFTYDSDMEWDAGAPWYRPTRINHIVSGGDYGWRQGTDKWRAWYPDSLPSNFDVGLGSPTTVKFGTLSDFSLEHQNHFFIADWAYGRILSGMLTPVGATYQATGMSDFISGRPLNVCDFEFGPDGAMYFVTGGRRTQSGLYRVVYQPDQAMQEAKETVPNLGSQGSYDARELRRRLESLHGRVSDEAVGAAWPHLGSADPWLRHAARVAIETQPLAKWRDKTLAEPKPNIAGTALLALARVGAADDGPAVRKRLGELDWKTLTAEQRLIVLRALQLSLIRQAPPTPEEIKALRATWERTYPQTAIEQNDLLCELLVYLQSPVVVERTLPLLDAAATPEEKFHYLMCLRLAKTPWTIEQRKVYFTWLQRAEKFPSAHYIPRFVAFIREEAIAALSEAEKQQLGALLQPVAAASEGAVAAPRPFVKAWTLGDFAAELDRPRAEIDTARAKALYIAADCAKCHRLGTEGALVGPDLTGVGKRFSRQDLLLSILEPSRVIDDKYKQKSIATSSGVTYTGQEVAVDDVAVSLITDPTQPTKITRIARGDIEDSRPSPLSPMPQGLINTLTKDEVLLLLDYISTR